jgi:hypothetical protein
MIAAVVRVGVAAGGGWLAVKFLGGSDGLFIVLGVALVIFGTINASAVAGGVLFRLVCTENLIQLPFQFSHAKGKFLL